MSAEVKSEERGQLPVARKRQGTKESTTHTDKVDILYSVDDIPPWYLCILLGFQQFLTMFGATFAYPLIIKNAICIDGDDVGLSEVIGTIIFVSGISTILQSTFGVRLPIIQSVSYSFITPVFVLMNINAAKCPFNGNSENATISPGSDEHQAIWQDNMRLLQGSLMIASLLSIIAGFTGVVGLLMRFIGPLTIAPTIGLIGLSLFEAGADKGASQWYICFMTVFLVALFSQYLRNVGIPFPCMQEKMKIFALFPVLLAVVLSWIICVILTETGALPREGWGSAARTDIRKSVLDKAEWFRFPYPGQWGVPEVTLAGVFGMMAAMLASIIESVGDYYACARLAGAAPPPGSAINRGIGMEGITCLLAGAWGTGGGNTSYSENIGAIGITKVGSRVVVQVAGVIMIIVGCIGKFGALFVTIPDPVVGGLFFVMFGMVGAVGISNLQFVDLNSSRNLFVFGVSFFTGLSLPYWVTRKENAGSINTGSDVADQVIEVLLGTSMFVGGVVAFVLDNTIPGTKEERGLVHWNQARHAGGGGDVSTYDLPLIQPFLNRIACLKYVPFCPSFILDHRGSSDTVDEESKSRPTADAEMGGGQENFGYQADALNHKDKEWGGGDSTEL